MTSYYLVSVAMGVVLALGILWLVRRDQLHGSYALWWLLLAVAALALGFFPRVVDWFGSRLGVAYPPMLLVMVAVIAILLKLLAQDVDVTRRERRLRRLLQKVAILEAELRDLRDLREAATPQDDPADATASTATQEAETLPDTDPEPGKVSNLLDRRVG